MSWERALLISAWKGQRSRSQCIDYWKWFMSHNCFPFTPFIMKLHTKLRLPMSQGCTLLILGLKGQRSRSQCFDNWKWLMSHNSFPFTHIIMWGNTKTPHESRICPMDIKVKSQGHNTLILENGLCLIIDFPLQLTSWYFTKRPWVADVPYWL